MIANQQALPSGSVIGGYRIDKSIGKGGFATVYRATRAADGAAVALKLLRPQETSAVDVKRFKREVELLRRLDHPNLVTLLDHGHTDDGRPYLVLELLEGESLKQKLKTEGALSIWRIGQIALQTLAALSAAHAMGVVHRDIKPANLFLCAGDATSVVRVLDFGISKLVVGDADAMTTLTNTGQVIGTPHYMAPEQVGGRAIGPATDIYSFGLVLAELITARRLMYGKEVLDIYMAQLSDRPVTLTEAAVDSPLGTIIARAVQKSVAARYPSADAMRTEIEAALHRHHRALSAIP